MHPDRHCSWCHKKASLQSLCGSHVPVCTSCIRLVYYAIINGTQPVVCPVCNQPLR